MGRYTVTAGQHIFDVALHLYGSIEGIVDLMMNNSNLSLASELKAGDELEFTDGFVINPDIVAHFRLNNIVSSNGERNVYYKSSAFQKAFKFRLNGRQTSAGFGISGAGTMEIDWGDNTLLETLALSGSMKKLFHTFDNTVSGSRKIFVYGDFNMKQADFTDFKAEAVLLFRPLATEKFTLQNAKMNIDFTPLLNDVYEINFSGLKTASLLPLLENKKLMKLDLSDVHVPSDVLDEYLMALVGKHSGRRSCTLILSETPSGGYHEPCRDVDGNYEVACGMEAVWLLCNEPAWNEAGFWKFIIGSRVYTSEINS
jgi:hypothetical protein